MDAARALELDVEDTLPAKKAKKMKNEESLNDAAETMGDVNMDKESSPESGSDGSDSNSDFSSEDGSSDVSDLDKFEEAFQEFGKLTAGVDPTSLDRQPAGHTNDDVAGLPLKGGFTTLQLLADVRPGHWQG